MKKLLFIIILIATSLLADASKPTISNIDFKYNGQHLVITYDILNSTPAELFNISVSIFKRNGEKIDASLFSGDVGKLVKGGLGKTIIWLTKGDNANFSENVYVEITAFPQVTISTWQHVTATAIYPGLGDYRLDNNQWHFAYGLLAYGALTSSIMLNTSSYNDYNNYLSATSTSNANASYNSAVTNQNLSYVLAGTAVAVWGYSIVKTYLKATKLKTKEITPQVSNYYYRKNSESIKGHSEIKYLEIKGMFFPPKLTATSGNDIKLKDNEGNEINVLNAVQPAKLVFTVENFGMGEAYDVTILTQEQNGLRGLDFAKKISLGTFKKSESKVVEIPISTSIDLTGGVAKFYIEVKEQNGFGADPIEVNISTKPFLEPKVVVADYKFTTEKGGAAKKGEKIFLEAYIQNIGIGDAKNVRVGFLSPKGVYSITEEVFNIDKLKSGEHTKFSFEFVTNNEYRDTSITIGINLRESWGRYAKSKDVSVGINQELQKKITNIYGDVSINTNIKTALLTSDVDINIPSSLVKNQNKYALVIGNEDYSSRQTNLSSESNVEFASDDARIFKEYLVKTLGFEEKNVFLLINATSGSMKQNLNRITELFSRIDANEAELIFYYAGHGYPDETTKIPYLIPVDVNVGDLSSAIKLSDVYDKLSQTKAKNITVFLDACFTGEGRNGGLLAARSARIKPQSVLIKGNMVVFNASSSEQSALPYKEQHHGMFTYYILKKLQESNGETTYGELLKYVKHNVSIESTRTIKPQDPEVNVSPDIKSWENWKFK